MAHLDRRQLAPPLFRHPAGRFSFVPGLRFSFYPFLSSFFLLYFPRQVMCHTTRVELPAAPMESSASSNVNPPKRGGHSSYSKGKYESRTERAGCRRELSFAARPVSLATDKNSCSPEQRGTVAEYTDERPGPATAAHLIRFVR